MIRLQETEKKLSGILYERGVNDKSFAVIRSKGDQTLFRLSTNVMKSRMGVPASRLLADFLPTISIKAKDFAAEMTSVNVQTKDLQGETQITKEHVDNNAAVRQMLVQRVELIECGWKPQQARTILPLDTNTDYGFRIIIHTKQGGFTGRDGAGMLRFHLLHPGSIYRLLAVRAIISDSACHGGDKEIQGGRTSFHISNTACSFCSCLRVVHVVLVGNTVYRECR
jgi:hypothetical protein